MARKKAKSAGKAAVKKQSNGANIGYEAELWKMADAMRGNLDAAEYVCPMLEFILLKCASAHLMR